MGGGNNVTYLYNEGDECTSITGGWTDNFSSDASDAKKAGTKTSSYIECEGAYIGTTTYISALITNRKINLKPYHTIHVILQGIQKSESRNYIILYLMTNNVWTSGLRNPRIDLECDTTDMIEVTFDISQAEDSVYFFIASPARRMGRMYKCWLE